MHENIALTGAATFLNTLVLKRLVELPQIKEIHIFDLRPPAQTSKKFIFHRLDLMKDNASADIAKILTDNKVTAFIHGALFSGPTRNQIYHHELESIGTYHVLNAVAEAKVQNLFIQSATFVYGAHPKNTNFIKEHAPLKMHGPQFVKTRVDVEQQVQDFTHHYPKCKVTVLRFAPILGPTSTNIRVRYFLSGLVPKVLGYDPLLQFIHEDDAVRAQILALTNPVSGIFNIAGKGVLPLSTGIHLAGKMPIPFLSTLCKTFFSVGYALHVWDLSADMVQFFQYMCVADAKHAEHKLGFVAKYSSRQALKAILEASKLRKVGFLTPTMQLGEEEAYATAVHGFKRIY